MLRNNVQGNGNINYNVSSVDSNTATLVPILSKGKKGRKRNITFTNSLQFNDNNIISNAINDYNHNIINASLSSSTSANTISNHHLKSNNIIANKLKLLKQKSNVYSTSLNQNNNSNININTANNTTHTSAIMNTMVETTKAEQSMKRIKIDYSNTNDTIILKKILHYNMQYKDKLIEECNILIELLMRKRYRNVMECKIFEMGGPKKRKLIDNIKTEKSK